MKKYTNDELNTVIEQIEIGITDGFYGIQKVISQNKDLEEGIIIISISEVNSGNIRLFQRTSNNSSWIECPYVGEF